MAPHAAWFGLAVLHRTHTGIIFGLWDQGLAWYKGGVAGEMSTVTELRLQDFDISEYWVCSFVCPADQSARVFHPLGGPREKLARADQ